MHILPTTLAPVDASKNREDQVIERAQRDSVQDDEQIKKLASEFESLFLDIVMKSMRQSVMKSGLIDGGNAEDIYQSMLDAEYSKIMSQQGVSGLSKAIEKQLREKMNALPGKTNLASEIAGKKVYTQERLR